MLEAPLEYELLMEAWGTASAPPADMIEAIGYASLNLLFKKPKFRKALIEYRKHGLYETIPRKAPSKQIEEWYAVLRQRNANAIMKQMKAKNASGLTHIPA